MNQNDKVRNALKTAIELGSRISVLEQNLADAKRQHEGAKADVIRVLKALGQQQVLFRGKVYALGTYDVITDGETPTEFLTINDFTGLVLPDSNGSSRGVRDLVAVGESPDEN